jgi:hypothetical protein
MFIASLFIIIGVVFLLKNTGVISQGAWGVIWPVALVALGGYILYTKHRVRVWRERIWHKLE